MPWFQGIRSALPTVPRPAAISARALAKAQQAGVAHDIYMQMPTDELPRMTVYGNMSSDIADTEIIFAPSSDLAIQNYIAREIIARNAADWDFVKKHTVFATGPYDIGYGFRPKNADKYASAAEMETYKNEQVRVLDKHEAIAQRRKEGGHEKEDHLDHELGRMHADRRPGRANADQDRG